MAADVVREVVGGVVCGVLGNVGGGVACLLLVRSMGKVLVVDGGSKVNQKQHVSLVLDIKRDSKNEMELCKIS